MPDPIPYTLQPYRTERSLFVAGFFSIYRGGEWWGTVKSEELAERIVRLLNGGERPLLYLASPYSHPDRAVRVARFEAANREASALMRDGNKVFSPISHTHPIAEAGGLPLGWDFWEQYDRALLDVCGRMVVLRLDGWQDSKGIAGELRIASEMGIRIDYADPSALNAKPVQQAEKERTG